jgi:hypothetical protein
MLSYADVCCTYAAVAGWPTVKAVAGLFLYDSSISPVCLCLSVLRERARARDRERERDGGERASVRERVYSDCAYVARERERERERALRLIC